MQVILDSRFARPGSAPIGGGKKGEFRDWTSVSYEVQRSFSTFGVARNDFFQKIFKTVLQKFAIQCK